MKWPFGGKSEQAQEKRVEVVRQVKNISGRPQGIGKVTIPVNGVDFIDIAPGTMGEALVKQRILQPVGEGAEIRT